MDTVFLALRVVVALGAVFGALFFGHRWITKGRPGAAARNRQIQVVARQGLGAKAGIAIVDAAGRRYLLGVTEHTVTVLDALGEVPAEGDVTDALPALLATQPVTVTRFEQELRTVTITTGNMPVLVQDGFGAEPQTPVPQTLAPMRIPAAAVLPPAAQPVEAAPASRRAARQAEQLRMQAQSGPLAGSVLSPATWRQTVDALKRAR